MNKIEMIQRSVRCLVFGLLGLIPVLGIPFACEALVQNAKIKRGQGDQWNPAARQQFWGALCARMGLWLFGIIPLLGWLLAIEVFNL